MIPRDFHLAVKYQAVYIQCNYASVIVCMRCPGNQDWPIQPRVTIWLWSTYTYKNSFLELYNSSGNNPYRYSDIQIITTRHFWSIAHIRDLVNFFGLRLIVIINSPTFEFRSTTRAPAMVNQWPVCERHVACTPAVGMRGIVHISHYIKLVEMEPQIAWSSIARFWLGLVSESS